VQTWSGAPEPWNGNGDESVADPLFPHAPRNNKGMNEAADLSGGLKHVLANIYAPVQRVVEEAWIRLRTIIEAAGDAAFARVRRMRAS
jgi:hypothetical protein